MTILNLDIFREGIFHFIKLNIWHAYFILSWYYVHYGTTIMLKMQQTLFLTRMNASSASPLKRCGLVVYLSREKMKLKLLQVRIVNPMVTILKAANDEKSDYYFCFQNILLVPLPLKKLFIIKFAKAKEEKHTSMLEKGLHKCVWILLVHSV